MIWSNKSALASTFKNEMVRFKFVNNIKERIFYKKRGTLFGCGNLI